MAERSDEQLLASFAKGDRASLGELAARYEEPLLGLACGLLGGRRDLAQDAVQDAWVKVIRFAGGFEGRSSVKTWLYRIVINRCRELRIQASKRNGAIGAFAEAAAPAGGGEIDDVRAAVDSLGEHARLVVLMCYHRGLTHEQAADILDLPLGTLKSRLHAALESLRARTRKDVAP